MNKLRKFIQCAKLRRFVLGEIGKNNHFRPGVMVTSAAKIGSNNYFGDRVMVGNGIIGNYCSFGPDVKIGQAQHAISYITTFQKICAKNINYSLNAVPSSIDNDVWIGANAVIMQGVKIGNGAVIGANAVVTEDVPPYAIVVGVPAKVLKFRFSEDVIDSIIKSKWWECESLEDAAKVVKDLEDSNCIII